MVAVARPSIFDVVGPLARFGAAAVPLIQALAEEGRLDAYRRLLAARTDESSLTLFAEVFPEVERILAETPR